MAWFRLGGAGISAALKNAMNAVLNKKLGTSQEYAPNTWPDNVNLMGALEEKTASGAIAHIEDGADGVPLKNWLVTLPASLDGYSEVNAVQSGKNLFDKSNPNEIDGYFTTTGFSTGNVNAKTIYIPIKGGTTWTVSKTAGQLFQIATAETIPANNATFTNRQAGNTNTSLTITAGASDKYLWAWVFLEGTDTGTLADMLASIQIEVGSTATAYEAYEAPTQYIASLGRTIYGGQADIVTGEGETKVYKQTFTGDNISSVSITYGQADTGYTHLYFYTSGIPVAYNPSGANVVTDIGVPMSAQASQSAIPAMGECFNLINTGSGANQRPTIYWYTNQTWSNIEDFKTWLNANPITVVYEVADEEPFTFTPITAETALGTNNFWTDEGDSAVTYRSSGTVTPVVPTLISKTITENGTYSAEDDDADGYSSVTVSVSGGTGFVPQFTETKIADNTSHASSFTLTEDYGNYDMVKIVWYESATSSGFLYTTPDILDEIFSVGAGKLCINKPSTNYYVCYTKNGLTWTQTNQRNIYVHEVYGVTFTNCTMTATDLYKRGASTITKYAVTSQTSLKDYDLFMMASIHNTDGSETMPTTWLYQYPPENMSEAFSCPVPAVLQEYNANDEAFVISEYGMTSARYFMVQGITFTPTPSLLSMGGLTSSSEEPTEPENNEEEEEE